MSSTILLVDDHPVFRQGLRQLLEKEKDLKVVGEAGDGMEAIDRLRELSPDIVVMDINMPIMEGIDAVRYIKKVNRDAVVIMFSAIDDEKILYSLSADIPVSLVISEELKKKAEEILDKLPDQCKKIYMLNRYENMSYSEIATKLNISVGTVKTQMFRAFQKLREGLKDFIT